MKTEKFPTQPELIFHGNASPEAIDEWLKEQDSYEDTVKNVLSTVILGSIFQFATFGMMILAFYIIDTGLNNSLYNAYSNITSKHSFALKFYGHTKSYAIRYKRN